MVLKSSKGIVMNQIPDHRSIAQEIITAQSENRQIEPFSSRIAELNTHQAYDIGRLIHQVRLDDGAQPAGRKIGFTNAAMWALYGVEEPIWSWMYDRSVHQLADSEGVCSLGNLCEPKLEPELVVHFHQTPPADGELSEILACIDWIALGYEMVQCHYPGWKFQGLDTIIDSGLHAELLLGTPLDIIAAGPALLTALEQFEVRLYLNGEQHDQGSGANVLGSPLKAVAHLISVIAANPGMEPIQAGELITTGTLTNAWSVTPGETWRTEVTGLDLPALTVRFEG